MTVTDDSTTGADPGEVQGEEEVPFSENPRHFGIDPGDPWPDDVPKGQDDTRWRYQDDPRGARRAEIRVALCWTVTVLASIGLMAVSYTHLTLPTIYSV